MHDCPPVAEELSPRTAPHLPPHMSIHDKSIVLHGGVFPSASGAVQHYASHDDHSIVSCPQYAPCVTKPFTHFHNSATGYHDAHPLTLLTNGHETAALVH
eukprot:7404790-Karenia_brevis.AAC.1